MKNKDNQEENKKYVDKESINFSDNKHKFKKECKQLVNFIKSNICDDFRTISIIREGNYIKYGLKYNDKKVGYIYMTSNEDLKKIYELLQCTFQDNFFPASKQTFGYGYSLRPFVGDYLAIDINSDNKDDYSWFVEEWKKEHDNQVLK